MIAYGTMHIRIMSDHRIIFLAIFSIGSSPHVYSPHPDSPTHFSSQQLKHFRDQREALTSQLSATNKAREDSERQCSELQAQLAASSSELVRTQTRLADLEQAAAAADRLHVCMSMP